MLLDTKGASCTIDGVSYKIGMKVLAKNSDYEGLEGVITEIRDGEDKETDNDTADIYCEFKAPEEPEKIKALEELFSALYGEKKTLDDICLDCVIMGPDMLEPLDN